MNPLKNISILISLLIITSCSEKLDFNQIEDFVFEPVLTASLTYFTVKPFQFFDADGNQNNTKEEITGFDAFSNSFFENNVVKIKFNAAFKNEFDRSVKIQVDFLDVDNKLLYSFTPILVNRKDLNPEPYEEEIIISENPDILNTTQARVTASIENTGSQMDPFGSSEFQFKSSITLFVQSEL
jgi:hypothetical protein